MGCGTSRQATAVTPAMTPAHAAHSPPVLDFSASPPLNIKVEQHRSADEHSKPFEEEKTSTPMTDSAASDGEGGLNARAKGDPSSSSSHHHHSHHHHHHRKPSTAHNSNSPPPTDSIPLPAPSPHNRTVGHARSNSRSFTVAEAGANPKEQMMANQVRRGMMVGNITTEGDSSSPPPRPDSLTVEEPKLRKRPSHSHSSASSAPSDKEKERERGKSSEEKETDADDDDPTTDGGSSHPHKKEKKEKKKKEKIIKTLELADLQHLSVSNLEVLWKNYDKDKNGTLDRKELKKLAKDCIGRTIAMCEEEIRRQQPKLTEAELRAAVEKELKFVLPGAAKENGKKEDVHKEMVRRLVKKLDVNGDGDVTKAELLATWNVFAKELFQMKVTEGPVNCSIM